LSTAGAASEESAASADGGVPLSRLIATVAKKSGKKFIVDPRVHGDATYLAADAANPSYADLLEILRLNGFTAVDEGGYVLVIPDASVRVMPVPQISGKETRPDAEYVSKIIPVKSVPAVQLVPLLRPLLPQQGHLAALPCRNVLIMVDTYANVRRIETLVQSLDTGEPFTPEKCEAREPAPREPPAPPRRPD
jgi:general secretion pathway protein D